MKFEEKKIKNFFDKFSFEFTLVKKIIFLIAFTLTMIAFGYWCYMLYKIYSDNSPLIGDGALQTWGDLYHYDTHLLAAYQATTLGLFLCIVIAVGF